MRHVVLTELTMNITVFWEVMQLSPVDIYQHFEQPCCLHLQGIREREE
jgi:hypothetical protein